jgi:hypothetical protein
MATKKNPKPQVYQKENDAKFYEREGERRKRRKRRERSKERGE